MPATPSWRNAFGVVALVVACTWLLATLSPVVASTPHRLAGPITDDVSALTGDTASVQSSLDELQRATGAQLWVWYTDTLEGQDASAFAAATAKASDLGTKDLLLVIALDDHEYGWWKGSGVAIGDAELDQVLSTDMEPMLQAADYPGAITATAAGLLAALTGGPTTAPETVVPGGGETPDVNPLPTPGSPASDGGSAIAAVILALIVVGLIGGVWWYVSRARASGGTGGRAGVATNPDDPNGDLAAMQPKDLDELANRILVETDDSIRDSDQELGFAQAQFGDEAATPFVAAIAAARGDLKGAFTLRQQLDDATPEDHATRRRMLTDLVIACRTAQGRLHAELQHFEELRALEKEAPDILARLPAAADAIEARLPAAQATLTGLAEYADADWQAVGANVDNARTRIAAVREAAGQGTKAVAAGTAGRAAQAARLGEDGLAQATAFLDAIDRLAAQLAEARSKVDAEIAAAQAEIAKAKAAATGAPPDVDATARLAEAEALLAEARTALDPPKPDVAGAYDKARRADDLADAIEQDIRNAAEQRARDAARLDAGLRTATVTVTRAADYIGGQRGGIGTEARTRLAEASRHLDQAVALRPTDAAGALAEADQATRLAAEAQRLAEADYGRWDDPFHGGPGPSGPGGGGGG
ncbi:MAG TPA: TPM domain-containing protein, partial [Candidatus Limnocylindrales bacterium]|nr:TPM domain-containing protein [Candidatus Limnocylindrales bacterium]